MSTNLMPRSLYWATDLNPSYLEYLVTLRATRPYMRVAHTNAMEAETFPTGQHFDTVVCLNVVEHVQDDVAALRNIRNALEGWGTRCRFWCRAGNGCTAHSTKCWGISALHGEQLRNVAEQAGFRVEQMLKFNRAGVPAWWLNGRILTRERWNRNRFDC